MRPVLRVVHTAYASEEDEDTWIDRVLHAMGGVLDGARGLCACVYRPGADGPDIALPRVVAADAATRDAVSTFFALLLPVADRALIRSVFRAPRRPIRSTLELAGRHGKAIFRAAPASLGVADFIGGRIERSDSEGLVMGSLLGAPARLDRAARTELTRLFAHIEAASRLRGARRPVATIARGQVTNVSDDRVRESLPELHASLAGMLASREGGSDLGTWSTRVDARYSLVATKRAGEADVLLNELPARSLPEAHDPRVHGVAKLLAEGHPQKLIAYELGIPEGSVYRHVARLKKLLREPTTVGLVARLSARDPSPWADPEARVAAREHTLAVLSPGERFVIEGALRGLAATEMARARGVSVRTTENVLRGAYRKLEVGSRKELAAKLAGG